MSGAGLVMFALALLGIVVTGLPAYAVLLAVAAVFAMFGVATGAFDASLLGALPFRIVGLLEHDLLQALALFALIGALLNRLPLAETLHRTTMRLFSRSHAAPELSALVVGALLAPMNGSVGASLHMLSRGIARLPRSIPVRVLVEVLFRTLMLMGSPLAFLPSHRGDRFPRSTQEPASNSRSLHAGCGPGRQQAPPELVPR